MISKTKNSFFQCNDGNYKFINTYITQSVALFRKIEISSDKMGILGYETKEYG